MGVYMRWWEANVGGCGVVWTSGRSVIAFAIDAAIRTLGGA